MNRGIGLRFGYRKSVPRVYGDEPSRWYLLLETHHVFPVCTGMNRAPAPRPTARIRVPRVYGDEPTDRLVNSDNIQVFPVCTGMNRETSRKRRYTRKCSPCVRG